MKCCVASLLLYSFVRAGVRCGAAFCGRPAFCGRSVMRGGGNLSWLDRGWDRVECKPCFYEKKSMMQYHRVWLNNRSLFGPPLCIYTWANLLLLLLFNTLHTSSHVVSPTVCALTWLTILQRVQRGNMHDDAEFKGTINQTTLRKSGRFLIKNLGYVVFLKNC